MISCYLSLCYAEFFSWNSCFLFCCVHSLNFILRSSKTHIHCFLEPPLPNIAKEAQTSASCAEPSQEEILDSPVSNRTLTTPPSSHQEQVNLTTIEKLTGDNFLIWKFQVSIMHAPR
jgi:hypothetical protein